MAAVSPRGPYQGGEEPLASPRDGEESVDASSAVLEVAQQVQEKFVEVENCLLNVAEVLSVDRDEIKPRNQCLTHYRIIVTYKNGREKTLVYNYRFELPRESWAYNTDQNNMQLRDRDYEIIKGKLLRQ